MSFRIFVGGAGGARGSKFKKGGVSFSDKLSIFTLH